MVGAKTWFGLEARIGPRSPLEQQHRVTLDLLPMRLRSDPWTENGTSMIGVKTWFGLGARIGSRSSGLKRDCA
jgi:hypothetical protein